MTLLDAPAVAEPHYPAADLDLIEPEDMYLYDDGRLYELIEGRLVEKKMSAYGQLTADGFDEHLKEWAKPASAGRVFVEATFLMFADRPRTVRRPDVAFVTADKVDAYGWDDPHIRLAPDLAVEIISPNDAWYNVMEKVGEYHDAGVPLVWLADPVERTVQVRPNPSTGGRPSLLIADDTITGGDVLPGFSCRVGDLFPTRPAPPQNRAPADEGE